MSLYLRDPEVTLYMGDALKVLEQLPEASVDSCVTDPPYGIRFMGKAWDGAEIEKSATERQRVGRLNDDGPTKSADDGYGSIEQPKLDRATPRENWEPHRTANHHPTVKPIALMRWLVRLVTPPGGLVLDPFLGSGTTGIACAFECFRFLGIEREADYMEIAAARIAHWRKVAEAERAQLALPLADPAGLTLGESA